MSKLTYGHVLVVPRRRLVRPAADNDFVKSIHHVSWRSAEITRRDLKRKETSKKLTLYYKEKYDELMNQNKIKLNWIKQLNWQPQMKTWTIEKQIAIER